jgi:uncharacterized membrane protein
MNKDILIKQKHGNVFIYIFCGAFSTSVYIAVAGWMVNELKRMLREPVIA